MSTWDPGDAQHVDKVAPKRPDTACSGFVPWRARAVVQRLRSGKNEVREHGGAGRLLQQLLDVSDDGALLILGASVSA